MTLIVPGPVVLDCPDPQALAGFYAATLDWEVGGDDDWAVATGPAGWQLAFQRVDGYTPPRWPGQEQPQQFHLDFDVARAAIDEAERRVLGLGAELVQPDEPERAFRVYLDPAGHPFCLSLR
ncbi:VOC family protein [Streptomyces pinistramenti]|uniref:VOC family protein n=1 Tax=Streptomyces pinistramenti TaxID=2884812 RepID=UPI001D069ABD|nr:VOC family protein [Streptomyces pinistramenti]MCB5911137.1 VOC family protein [Streptomyces pinistramenti]